VGKERSKIVEKRLASWGEESVCVSEGGAAAS
jgi:hypothetical protein